MQSMVIRTFFWHDRVIKPHQLWWKRIRKRKPHRFFTTGNAGDIFTRDIIAKVYSCGAANIRDEGNRLLVVGSISHKILPGDVICGIGTKDKPVPDVESAPCHVFGLRGPITYEKYKQAGHDMSQVRFLMDPGLLLRFYVDHEVRREPKGAAFIPHYRERDLYTGKLPKDIRFIDIDSSPEDIAKKILSSELVYSSSLHGIIFAHALNRPCVFVQPQGKESLSKYEDYYESINIKMPVPISSINDVDMRRAPVSPPDLKYTPEDFAFPDLETLKALGVCNP